MYAMHSATGCASALAALDWLGRVMWHEMRAGQRVGLSLNEESITDYALMRFAYCSPRVLIAKHSKAVESRSGADWEWWLEERSGFWRGYRIQAKRSDNNGAFGYRSLTGARAKGRRQAIRLIRNARVGRWPVTPLYAFYNAWSAVYSPWPSFACPRLSTDPALAGWTALDARVVLASLGPTLSICPAVEASICTLAHPIGCQLSLGHVKRCLDPADSAHAKMLEVLRDQLELDSWLRREVRDACQRENRRSAVPSAGTISEADRVTEYVLRYLDEAETSATETFSNPPPYVGQIIDRTRAEDRFRARVLGVSGTQAMVDNEDLPRGVAGVVVIRSD
jgi:hypothetical protein